MTPIRIGDEGAMLDKITRRIFKNKGTGKFAFCEDVQWIQSTGEQMIATDVYGRDGLIVKCRFMVTDEQNLKPVFSARTGNPDVGDTPLVEYISLRASSAAQKWSCQWNTEGAYSLSNAPGQDVWAEAEVSTIDGNRYLKCDGVVVKTEDPEDTFPGMVGRPENGGFELFARRTWGETYQYGNVRISSFTVQDATTHQMLCDLQPVRVGDGLGNYVGGMYDKISKKLHLNTRTGDFLIGPLKS